MPVVNGRLTCCTCGADLGDADDPFRDPTCVECLNEAEGFDQEEENIGEEAEQSGRG